jgi:serine O-acetyltransferase
MKVKDNLVAIVGFHDGSAGQVESWFEKFSGFEIACFIIDSNEYKYVDITEENIKRACKSTSFPENSLFKGRPLIVSSDWLEIICDIGIRKVLCLDPDNRKRLAHITMVKRRGLQLVSAIHPSVIMMSDVKIADGVWINAACVIGYKAEIGSGVIINTGAQIDHHNIVEACCQIDPGVVTAGNVVLRQCCHLHTGAILINRVEVGSNSVVGAGAVVLQDIPANSTAVGVPARVIRQNKDDGF